MNMKNSTVGFKNFGLSSSFDFKRKTYVDVGDMTNMPSRDGST